MKITKEDLADFKKKHEGKIDKQMGSLLAALEAHLAAKGEEHDSDGCRPCQGVMRRARDFEGHLRWLADGGHERQEAANAEHAAAVEADRQDPEYERRVAAEHEQAVTADKAAHEEKVKKHAEESRKHAESYKGKEG